jgi:universal stress protein E
MAGHLPQEKIMTPVKSILLATDFKPMCADALSATIQLAQQFGARVSVLHVIQAAGAISHLYGLESRTLLMQPVLEKLAVHQVTVTQSAVKSGSAATTIVNVAQEWNADLIVIGAGERKLPVESSIGPIAEAVITHALQPVLAVRPGSPQISFKRILCPVDQSSASARGLQKAVRFAKAFGAELVVLSVVPEVSWLTAVVETGEVLDAKSEYAQEWNREFEQFLQSADLSGTHWKPELRSGVPHEQIVAAAREQNSDLIVMGATGNPGLLQALLGSTTKRLLQRLPCSLLAVKQAEVVEESDSFEHDIRDIGANLADAQNLLQDGDFVSAIVKYRRVLARNRFHLAALEGLAIAHEKLGETLDAARYRRRLDSARRVAHPHLDSTDVAF